MVSEYFSESEDVRHSFRQHSYNKNTNKCLSNRILIRDTIFRMQTNESLA